jgi:hypothetical protein
MPAETPSVPKTTAKSIKWWSALLGIVLFLVAVAPDYAIQHTIFGGIILLVIHLVVAFLWREQTEALSASKIPALVFLLPLSIVGLIGVVIEADSAWHAYFLALAIGSFTAICRFFPNQTK